MRSITISVDEELLQKGKAYALKHRISLDALICELLEQTVRPRSKERLEECFSLMDRANASSEGRKWRREDIYDV